MPEYNNITQLIKFLFNQCKTIITDRGIFYFINLIAIQSIIMLSIILFSEWINNNMNIFELSMPMLLLRISLFSLFLGIWIGYFKMLLNYIDGKQFSILKIIKYFYLLPRILLIRMLSYATILPLILFIMYKFQINYNLIDNGTDINMFLNNLAQQLTTIYLDEISWKIISSYFQMIDLVILCICIIFPIWFSIRFWCSELLIIDKEMNIKNSLLTSYALTTKTLQFIIISCIILSINILFSLFGYFFFTIGLMLSYLSFFIYYRYLKQTMANQLLNK